MSKTIVKEDEIISRQKLKKSLERAKQVLDIEARSILGLKQTLDSNFIEVMQLILKSKGKVVFIGVGKSGLVARKIAATFSSLGTSSFFVHAGEALHGDLGMITAEDVVIAVSNSGETDEVLNLLPSLRRIGAKMVTLTGESSSTLGEFADLCLDAGVQEEACAIGLAPTASTTATLALGDALAIALSTIKKFRPQDYAIYHPGGSLGKRLLTTVKDVLKVRQQNPIVSSETTVKDALFTMTKSKMGSTAIVNQEEKIIGIITDGDIRRLLEKSTNFIEETVKSYMTVDPITITEDRLATEALKIMEEKQINDLPVIKEGKPVGMLNFQDLLRAKVF